MSDIKPCEVCGPGDAFGCAVSNQRGGGRCLCGCHALVDPAIERRASLLAIVKALAERDPYLGADSNAFGCGCGTYTDEDGGGAMCIHEADCLVLQARMVLGFPVPWEVGGHRHRVAP